MMILPYIEVVTLKAERRVTAFPVITSENRRTIPALTIQDVNSHGIIRLTFTA